VELLCGKQESGVALILGDILQDPARGSHSLAMHNGRCLIHCAAIVTTSSTWLFVRLPKSNLEKINAVRESGIEIVERMSADVPASAYSADYLAIKQDHLS
jgi:hypothetical protein